jgi:hypothetical protein
MKNYIAWVAFCLLTPPLLIFFAAGMVTRFVIQTFHAGYEFSGELIDTLAECTRTKRGEG